MWFFSQKEIKREEYFEEIKILIYQGIRLLFSKKTKVFYKVNPDNGVRYATRYRGGNILPRYVTRYKPPPI